MATSPSALLVTLLLLLFALPYHSSATTNRPAYLNLETKMSVWDLLEYNGLPRGLLPDSVTDYTLNEDTRRFVVTLPKPCQVQFNHRIAYDTNVNGTLNFGSIKELMGVRSVGWIFSSDITAIEADMANAKVEIQVGFSQQTYPASDYEVVRSCMKSIVSLRDVFLQIE